MLVGVVIEETWAFFNEIYAELTEHHQTRRFERRSVSLPLFNNRANQMLFQRDLRAFLGSNQVVFFEWASELLQIASTLPKACGIVTRLHRYEMYRPWLDHIDWEVVDRIILVSHAKRQEFLERFPRQASKIAVIPEAVSLERFQFNPRKFKGNIGIMGNLSPRKRVYELILAFNDLVKEHPSLHLHIGGGKHPLHGDYYLALHRLVHCLGLQDHVTFYGNVNDPQDWYQKIEVFISNSYSEGLQVSPMEAIASGCYCLSHRWDGADELFPDENLFFSQGELIEKLVSFWETSEAQQVEKIATLYALLRERFDINQTKVHIRHLVEEVGSSFAVGSGRR
jgi:glycosyltransferase involved in cell wall biosynthesis